ncbi:unnamed protein product, partial [Musa textilis]
MADSSDSSPMGFLWRHYEEVKEHWKSNFAFLDYYKKTLGRKEPLPKWTDADVEEFIAADPVYGPQVLLPGPDLDPDFSSIYSPGGSRSIWFSGIPSISLIRSTTAGFVLATAFGALCGGVFGLEVAEHWGQLYKIDKQAANLRFLYWWEDKISG